MYVVYGVTVRLTVVEDKKNVNITALNEVTLEYTIAISAKWCLVSWDWRPDDMRQTAAG